MQIGCKTCPPGADIRPHVVSHVAQVTHRDINTNTVVHDAYNSEGLICTYIDGARTRAPRSMAQHVYSTDIDAWHQNTRLDGGGPPYR